jgi:alkaline phosphatase
MKRFTLTFVLMLFAVAASAADIQPVKYVFLFIGDGMSIPQRTMAEEFLKKTENRGLRINALTHQALTRTQSANSFITDSAASGTAIACGEKTNNGYLGVDPQGNRLESIAEVAHKNGKKVGIITSVTLNHATPAAFYAHNSSRGNNYEIGLDLIASGFEYFGGGGLEKHNDTNSKKYRGDIYELAKDAGYVFSSTPEEFRNIKRGMNKVLSIGTDSSALPYAIDTPELGLHLSDYTRQCIELLDNPNGFFIMVEGGAIDWMCHANDAGTTLNEIIEFDNAFNVAWEFAQKHPRETLIVVTGDHETGGLTLGFSGTGYAAYLDLLKNQKCSTGGYAELFKKFAQEHETYTFNDLKPLITEKSGLIFAKEGEERPKPEKGTMILTENEEKNLTANFEKMFSNKKEPDAKAFARAIVRQINAKAGIGWTSDAHTALPVITTAWGSQSEIFSNYIDNTDISKLLKETVKTTKQRPGRGVFRLR